MSTATTMVELDVESTEQETTVVTQQEPIKKKTSYELISDAGAIQFEIQKLLIEEPEGYVELIDLLQAKLLDCYDSMEDKVRAMRWIKDKINEEIVSAGAVKKMYKEQCGQFGKTETSRKADLERLRERVVLIISKLPEGKVKVDGKNVSVVERITGTIEDEVLANSILHDRGLSSTRYIVDGMKMQNAKLSLSIALSRLASENGEPKPIDAPQLITVLTELHGHFADLDPEYVFETGAKINKYVSDTVKQRRERKALILERFGGVEVEDLEPEELQEYEELWNNVTEELPLNGISVNVSHYPHGF